MPNKRRIGPRPIHIADGLSELMTPSDVSRLLKCTTQTVNNLRNSGALPFVAVGPWSLYRRQDVEDLAEQRRRFPSKMTTRRARGVAY